MNEPKYDMKKLLEYCKEWSEQEINIECAKDVKASIAESANEKLGMEKAEFNALAKLWHNKKHHPSKFEKEKAKSEYVEIVEGL